MKVNIQRKNMALIKFDIFIRLYSGGTHNLQVEPKNYVTNVHDATMATPPLSVASVVLPYRSVSHSQLGNKDIT